MDSEEAFRELKNKIRNIGGLPTLPNVASRVMGMASDPQIAMRDLARVIAADSALTGKILKVANSPLYGVRRKIGSLQLAITLLGMREIMHLVTSISVFQAFPKTKDRTGFDVKSYWRHSAACGLVTRALAKALGQDFKGEAFTAGLLHDMGKLVLDQYFHNKFQNVFRLIATGSSAVEAEEQIFIANHAQVGGWLAATWNLPKSLCDPIAWHHMPEYAISPHENLTYIVHIADIITHKLGKGFGNVSWKLELDFVPSWEQLQELMPIAKKFTTETILEHLKPELAKVQTFLATTTG